jgi:histone deacetylase 6
VSRDYVSNHPLVLRHIRQTNYITKMDLDEDISMSDFDASHHHNIPLPTDSNAFSIPTNGHEESLDPSTFLDPYDADELAMPMDASGESDQINNEAATPPHKLSIVEAGDAIVKTQEIPTPTQSTSEDSSAPYTPTAAARAQVIIKKAPDPVLPYSSSRTGLVYDARMRFHTELGAVADDDIHPEDPRRIWEIFHELVVNGLVDSDTVSQDIARQAELAPYRPQRLLRIPTRLAEDNEIALAHSREHVEWVGTLSS